MSDEQTTLNLDNIDLSGFNNLDVPMSAEDVMRDQKKTRLNATMSQAVIQNPTQTAKVRDLSRRSGIPAQAVESDIPSVETHLKLKNINLDDMVRTHPVTSDYLSQYDNAAVAHDDIDTLKNLESLMNPPATVQPEYLPFNTLRGLGGRITGLLGSLASGISQASDSIEENFPTGAFTIVGGIPMYIPPEQWSTLRKAGVGKDAVAAVGDELKSQDFGYIPRSTWDSTKEAFSNDGIFSGTAEALSFGVESGVVSLADMAATVYALPAYIFARSEEMGQARAKNKGMEKGTIRETLEAAPFAVGSAILERILPEKVLGGMSKTEIEKVGKAILEGATSKVKEVLNRATNGLIIEASTEAVQEGIIEYLGEKYGTDSNIVLAEMIDRALGGAVGGGIAGGAIAGGVETVNVNRSSVEAFFNEYAIRKLDAAQKEEMRLHLKGIQEQKSIDGINEYSANSELRKIDPDSFRQFIDQSDGDKDLSIFIDGVQAKLYVAQLPESNDPVVQMLNAKVSEAAALGSDVAIPIADFATMMAGTEHYDALREFMTLSGETTAPFRQEQRTTEFDNYIQSLMTEAEENTSSYVEAQDTYNSVREQLIDTGVVSGQNAAVMAQLVPAWATVFAQRNGITIKEAYEQSGLLIQGPQTGEAARLAAEAEQLTQMEGFDNVDAQSFRDLATTALANNPNGGAATIHTAEEYAGMDLYTTDEGRAGFAIENGMLMSVFKDPSSTLKGAMGTLVPAAIKAGANRLEAFDGFLTEQYAEYGFEEIDRIPWDDNFAPSGWDTQTQGRPDVVVMKLKEKDNARQQTTKTPENALQQSGGVRGSTGVLPQQNSRNAEREADGSLQGLPRQVGQFTASAWSPAQEVARKYAEKSGIPYNPPATYAEVDVNRARRIADAFEQGKHDPQNPEVKAAYQAMIDETLAQYESILESGLVVEFIDFATTGDPYDGSPRKMTEDVINNNHMYVFSTRDGFGSSELDVSDNPLLAETEFDISGQKALANDIFRVVHDYFGHVKEGVGFRASGEENAWRAHSAMYSPLARRAMTTETRGQNSWVNFGPNSEFNKTASGADTVYADQKVMLLPEWVSTEAAGDSEQFNQNQGVTRGYYSPSESIIRLNEAANLSTFLHEFAHFMYEMELTSAKQTPDSVNMISSIHNWYKRNADDVAKEAMTYADMPVTSDDVVMFLDSNTTGDEAKDKAIRRAVHEQFARGFETYLMEGKAPSIELRNAFRTFARWLTQVYRAVRGNLKVNLDPEMRKVFDTLLATEEQINAAEARANYAPMFTDAAMAGMTEQEFAEYKQKQDKVKDKQTETLRDKLIAEITRQSTKQWKEELADEVDVQTEALKTERVYRAREALKEGEIKLDHAATKDLIGEDVKDKRGRESRRIPPKLNGMTIKGAQGVHPDEAAALLGYGSGDEMLADLMDAPTIKERAEAQAEAVMLERHGDILHDGTIEKQADDALLNEERGALILTELKALGKGTKAPAIDRQMLKSMAEESIGKLAYRNIHPEKYRKAEIRAAQESAAALQAGNKEGAMSAKVRQAMNFYLHKAATEARNDTMKIVERMARYNTKTVREAVQKAENGYWEQIVKILNRFEFRKSASLRGVDQRNQDINSWVKERVEIDGDALILTPEVLDELFTTHWKNVEYDKLKGINDSVKNIEHVARYANKIKTMGEEIEFKKLVNRWTTHMDAATTTRFKSQRTDVAEGRSWGRMAMAQMTKIPFLASWLDGGERGGMSHDILVQPFTDAQAEEVKLWTDVGRPVMELIEGRSKADIKRHNTKVFIRELVDENNDGNLYGNQIVAVALNTGNAGNLRKMLLGEGWANAEDESSISLDNPKLQAILRRMTKSDWDLVQTIWDRMELLYPQLSEVHRRTTGLVPPKVEATPVQTPYGEYKGGYYPVKYDPNRSQRAQDNEDKLNAQVDSMFSNSSSIQASVTASSTNERTKYYAPIRLSLDVVPAHFQEAIHFITHHDAVRQANKLIRNPEVTKTIKEKLGPEEYAQLKPWLNDIAKDGREANTKLWWEDMIGRLRFGITLGSMGFKASTGIMQLLGVSNIAAEVGSKYAYQAFREIMGSPANMKNAWEFASSNSKILNNRVNNMDREIKNAMSRINSQINIKSGSKVKDIFYRFDNSNLLKTVQEASMKHIAYIQTYMVDLPTWYAAYIKELEAYGDEAKAYRVADTTVEMIQGSGATKDLAAIMRTRNETTRMLTMFMTFFSSLWNMNRDLVKGAKSGQYSVTTVAAKLMFLTVVPVAAEMLLRGEFDDDEDEDTRLQKFLTKTALYPVASLPFVRDIASGTVGEFGYNMSPVASLVEQGTNSIPELLRRPFTDEEITKGQVKGGSKFVAAALGIPATGQIWATGEHLYEVLEDGEELTARELLFGPKK